MEQQVPNILTLANKERFRRKVNIFTLILGFLLVFVMIWAGYMHFNEIKTIGTNYCYACGYYYGKECKQVYVQPYLVKTPQQREAFLRNLAESNAKAEPSVQDNETALMGILNISNTTGG